MLVALLFGLGCEPTRGTPLPDRGGGSELPVGPAMTGSELPVGPAKTGLGLGSTAAPEASGAGGALDASQVSAAPTASLADAGRLPAVVGGANVTIASFSQAKRELAEIYADHRSTIYCGCAFDEALKLTDAGCDYRRKTPGARARRVEWEHVVPAEAFGRSFVEWREGHVDCVDRKGKSFRGRQCARKASREFRLIEADLYNLYPAIGELNGLRSNFAMAEIEGEAREYGACDVEILERKFEPRSDVKGDVARTYLYMDQAYPGRGIVSAKNRKLFAAWSELDPVDDWECERAARIVRVQGNRNPVLAASCERRR